jgi:formamidopyrimidine-DNA glycosylase
LSVAEAHFSSKKISSDGAADPPLIAATPHVNWAMPELAEVEWYRKQWDLGLGDRIAKVELHARKRVFRGTNTGQLRELLAGQTFARSNARGKRMLFLFSGDNWLGIHLGMTGSLRIEPADFRPAKHDHLVLRQAERCLVFRDSRQFGRVRFHHGKKQPDWWRTDVPEIGARDFDASFVDHFLKRHCKAPIKAVLLLQDGFSGIGNWMADEILWRAKILPTKPAGKLSAAQRDELWRETRFVVKHSLETLGRDYSDPPRTWLIHERWSTKGVCPKHRTVLRRATIGGRTTAWCAKCQR